MEERILDYQKPPRRWRMGRRTVFLLLLITSVAIAIVWGPPLKKRATFLYWRHECLNYTMPVGLVVYDSSTPTQVLSPCIPAQRFAQIMGQVLPSSSVIFLHRMNRPDGAERLVELSILLNVGAVRGSILGLPGSITFVLTVSSARGSNDTPTCDFNSLMFPAAAHVKIFTGQPDSQNPSHFAFDYEIDGNRHTSDVWLDNSDHLLMTPLPNAPQ
jgi:hypothetical protein